MKKKNGFTLIEILVVVAIFAILGILVTRAVILSLTGSKKSESVVRVRENLDYTIGVITRQLRNADSVPVCSDADPTTLNYIDQSGNPASFSCLTVSGVGEVASTSAILTSSDVNVVGCSITCNPGAGTSPPVVTISLEARDVNLVGAQGADVSVSSQVSLRNY